ncbi:MAG: DNA polymerase III subunit [Synergistetes bacterium]|nr:DNA polymerase III subunit [Synergistota bacterium]
MIGILKSALKSGRISHAYMFYGEGELKDELALRFAQAVFCNSITDDACGECSSCRKVEAGIHSDFKIVQPEGVIFKISQVRSLRAEVSLKPIEADRRVFILKGCERMNLPSANAILKILEEPPSWAVLILLVSHPSTLPPTVVSRCQVFRVQGEKEKSAKEEILSRILNLKEGSWKDLYELSSLLGSMDRMELVSLFEGFLDLLSEREDYLDIMDEILSVREGLMNRFLSVQMAVDRILFRIKGEW